MSIVAKLQEELEKYYHVKAAVGNLSEEAYNIRIIHDGEYYAENEMHDPHSDNLKKYIVQHITEEVEHFTNIKGSSPDIKKIVQELIIKGDVRERMISIFDWERLDSGKDWTFVLRKKIKTKFVENAEDINHESNRITNQRAFIRSYINKDKALSKMNMLEFVDDGYTGKNMDRPDMQRMLDLVKKKQTSCVIVKDFSRFPRDHIEQGKYIEQILPFMGVRFIAINDNYDSADYVGGIGEIDVAFKGILYDFFSEEQSVKVSTTLDAKRGSGKYISAFAPYGYMKSPEDKHNLVVDEYASQIVKRIFREYLSGKSMYKIAESLN